MKHTLNHRRCWKRSSCYLIQASHLVMRFRKILWSSSPLMERTMFLISVLSASAVRGLFLYTFRFKLPHRQKSQIDRLGERGGHKPWPVICSPSNTSHRRCIELCAVALSCWKQQYLVSSSVSSWKNGLRMSLTYLSEFTASSKNIGLITLQAPTAHHTPTFMSCNGFWCRTWGFSVSHMRLFWALT
jgi:hypothetical protein